MMLHNGKEDVYYKELTCAAQNDPGLAGNMSEQFHLNYSFSCLVLCAVVWTVDSSFAGGYQPFSLPVNGNWKPELGGDFLLYMLLMTLGMRKDLWFGLSEPRGILWPWCCVSILLGESSVYDFCTLIHIRMSHFSAQHNAAFCVIQWLLHAWPLWPSLAAHTGTFWRVSSKDPCSPPQRSSDATLVTASRGQARVSAVPLLTGEVVIIAACHHILVVKLFPRQHTRDSVAVPVQIHLAVTRLCCCTTLQLTTHVRPISKSCPLVAFPRLYSR